MFVAHLETTTGKTTIGLVDLAPEDMDSAFHALVGMLGQVSDPIVMTGDHVDIFEAPPETPATLTFKYLGSRSAEFGDQEAFATSMNENLLMKVFQCPTAFDADEQGRIKAEFECFLLIEEGAADTTP
jgi:hypothetical protein